MATPHTALTVSAEQPKGMTLAELRAFCDHATASGATGTEHVDARVTFRQGIKQLSIAIAGNTTGATP